MVQILGPQQGQILLRSVQLPMGRRACRTRASWSMARGLWVCLEFPLLPHSPTA
jgi:hypothetical protein